MDRKEIPTIKEETVKRFWDKVSIPNDNNSCWEWIAGHHKDGYGVFGFDCGVYLSHRISYFLSHKIDPREKQVCHKCDNPNCVNPNHLFLGTQTDNVHDMNKKGRHGSTKGVKRSIENYRKGVNINTSKLNETQVIEIRRLFNEDNIPQFKLATMFNVGRCSINNIVRNIHWRHIL